jgi:hypothetical protein
MNKKNVLNKLVLTAVLTTVSVFVLPHTASADSVSVNFENPPYVLGTINAQDGWSSTGSAGAGCALYDHAVAKNIYRYTTFGDQSLRISDALTSGCFGDQTFAKPLTNSVGETAATAGTFSPGTKQQHFETQFDIASTMLDEQPGMHVSVSPDRGDGSRMSYLRFEDGITGIDAFFDDVQGTTNPANFVETQIAAGLNPAIPHTIKLTMDVKDGPSNDIVKVYIDGVLVQTGTSWENYYRYDTEAAAEQSPRIVKTVLFRTSGAATPADAGKGFLFDNLSLFSGPIPVGPPTDVNQCKNNGWKTFNNPTFNNQGQCVSFVNNLNHHDDVQCEGNNHGGNKYSYKHNNHLD